MPEFGRRGISYTPFVTETMRGMNEALMGRREQSRADETNALASKAWMGDMQAMQELATLNPELAMQIEDQSVERKATEEQRGLDKDVRFQKDMELVMNQIAAFPDFASAQAFGQRMTDMLLEKYPERMEAQGQPAEFTEQVYNQIRIIGKGLRGMKTVGSPYQVEHPVTGDPATAILRDDGRGGVYEELMEGPSGGSSLTRLSQYDVDLKRALAEAQGEGKELGQTMEQRAQTAIDAGVAAAVVIPNINRSLALLDRVETSGLKEDIAALQQYLGYEGEETADLSELQQLLASQMFDTLANFTGSISEGELRTAKALSTGLSKNTEANKRILRAMQQRLARAVDLAKTAATQRNDVVALEMLETFDPYAAAPFQGAGEPLPPAAASTKTPAPQAAIDYLKVNPDQIEAFVNEYGYRPEGY